MNTTKNTTKNTTNAHASHLRALWAEIEKTAAEHRRTVESINRGFSAFLAETPEGRGEMLRLTRNNAYERKTFLSAMRGKKRAQEEAQATFDRALKRANKANLRFHRLRAKEQALWEIIPHTCRLAVDRSFVKFSL